MVIDGNESVGVGGDADIFGVEIFCSRASSDGDEEFVGGEGGRFGVIVCVNGFDDDRFFLDFGLGDFCAEVEGESLFCEGFMECFCEFFVHTWCEGVEVFDDGDFGTESSIDRTDFESDDAASDDDEVFGYFLEVEGSCGRDDHGFIDGDSWQGRGRGTRGDDDGFFCLDF